MRTLVRLAVTFAAAALAPLALATPAFASGSTIVVFDHQSHFRFDNSSQTFTFNGVLHMDGRHGEILGSAKVSCVELPNHQQHCTATATFTGQGQIFVEGTVNSNKVHFFLPITGGNGDFAGASGQIERTGLGGNLEELVFHLR
jgi:hypothetical protein